MNNKRISWLDGLRGFACLMIFLHHFMVGFFPSSYYGSIVGSHGNCGWDTCLSQHPISVIINGNFWVCVFCLLSGLVQSYKIFNLENVDIVSSDMVKRYFRLSLPVFFVSLVVYFLMRGELFFNANLSDDVGSPWLATYYLDKVPIRAVFETSFVSVWLNGDSTFSNAFWMLTIIFFGSYLTYILALIAKGKDSRIVILLSLVALLFYQKNNYYICFVGGVIIAYFLAYGNNDYKYKTFFGVISLIIGMFLGGYPSGVAPTNIYRYFQHFSLDIIHVFGAILFVLGICNLRLITKFLEKKSLLWLGKISFGVFLVHIPIIFSIGTYSFMKIYNYSGRYQFSAFSSLGISLVTTIFCAWLFNRYVEKLCGIITTKIIGWFKLIV